MFPLEITPLLDRAGEDAALLARGLLEEMNQASGIREHRAPGPSSLLQRHPRRGNVRAPGNHLHRVFIMAG